VTLPSWPSRSARRLLAAGIFFASLAGCATPQLHAIAQHDAQVPQRVELEGVPFYPQDEYQCGPAALATVLRFAGKPVEPEALQPQVYLPGRHGSLQVEMLAAARRNGLVAVELRPSLSDLLAELAAGNPAIVLQNLAFSWSPIWHYAVAIGYDLEAQRIVLRSGRERRLEVGLAAFERTWKGGDSWAMLALPPQRMPASVTPRDYLSAVARLERVDPRAARTAYQSVLTRAPDELVALLGLGNTAYAAGDFESAERAFRKAALAHPGSAAAHNNLAQALADLKRYEEALAEARIAVGLGGPLEEVSTRTLNALVARAGLREEMRQ
jgi:tetratricopeptide (TPR) repeat protein